VIEGGQNEQIKINQSLANEPLLGLTMINVQALTRNMRFEDTAIVGDLHSAVLVRLLQYDANRENGLEGHETRE
jgi:hypothetical protein